MENLLSSRRPNLSDSLVYAVALLRALVAAFVCAFICHVTEVYAGIYSTALTFLTALAMAHAVYLADKTTAPDEWQLQLAILMMVVTALLSEMISSCYYIDLGYLDIIKYCSSASFVLAALKIAILSFVDSADGFINLLFWLCSIWGLYSAYKDRFCTSAK